ncbi:MAG TPA: hypothetical protein VF148_11660 [Acidimicrobiia bacterium]
MRHETKRHRPDHRDHPRRGSSRHWRYALYQVGYQNGLAETASEVAIRGPHFFPPFGFFFGLFFGFRFLLFLLFLFGFISRLFFWGRWRGGWYVLSPQ